VVVWARAPKPAERLAVRLARTATAPRLVARQGEARRDGSVGGFAPLDVMALDVMARGVRTSPE